MPFLAKVDDTKGMIQHYIARFDGEEAQKFIRSVAMDIPESISKPKRNGDYDPEKSFYAWLSALTAEFKKMKLQGKSSQRLRDKALGINPLEVQSAVVEKVVPKAMSSGSHFPFQRRAANVNRVTILDGVDDLSDEAKAELEYVEDVEQQRLEMQAARRRTYADGSGASSVAASQQEMHKRPFPGSHTSRPSANSGLPAFRAPASTTRASTPAMTKGFCRAKLFHGVCEKHDCPWKHDGTADEWFAEMILHLEDCTRPSFVPKPFAAMLKKMLDMQRAGRLTASLVDSFTYRALNFEEQKYDELLIPRRQREVPLDTRANFHSMPEFFEESKGELDTSDFENASQAFSLANIPPNYGCVLREIFGFYAQELSVDISQLQRNRLTGWLSASGVKSWDGNSVVEEIPLECVLDTGSEPFSVVAKEIVDQNQELRDRFVPQESFATLADKKTRVRCYGFVEATLRFEFNGKGYIADVHFNVMDMERGGALIGLYDIAFKFLDLLIDLLKTIASQLRDTLAGRLPEPEPPPTSVSAVYDTRAGLQSPWSEPLLETPEEELDTPMPASYDGPLYHLSKPWEEVHAEYLAMLEAHIDPDFSKACPEFLELLKSPLCLDVFLPKSWEGLSQFEPYEIDFDASFPDVLRAPPRHFNPKLAESAYKEFKRLRGYFFSPSTSTVVSPMVLAPKATEPFVRFCIDLRVPNKYIKVPQDFFKNVRHELEKAIKFRIFGDLDAANAFHQIRLGPISAARLSVMTPWGHFQPNFLPEGVGPASGALNRVVFEIFAECEEWIIVIHDNFLVCAMDEQDLLAKLKIVFEIAKSHNLILKMQKSWFGKKKVNFFGYEVSQGNYGLTAERAQQVMSIPFPKSLVQMQRFLGAFMYFKPFIAFYSHLTARLTEMTRKEFSWDRSKWTYNYEADFEAAKESILDMQRLYLPDYSADWLVQADASQFAAGAVLMQIVPSPADPNVMVRQVLAYASHKFSGAAFRWDIPKKEAYALYFAVTSFSYYLNGGKFFVLETDHRNLLWMESATAAIVIRWRVNLQSFNFLLRDIPGKANKSDWLSRLEALRGDPEDYTAPESADSLLTVAALTPSEPGTPEHLVDQVHDQFHDGARRTWNDLNEVFPGHGIPFAFVQDRVAACPTCQKTRLGMTGYSLQPMTRHLKVPHTRSRIGVDRLAISPTSRSGCNNLIVIVESFSGYTNLFATKDYTAETLASCLLQYYGRNGLFEELISDPGSDLMSNVVKLLHAWLGVKHLVSLVDRHESNGVEPRNKEILRHARAIVFDKRLEDRWDEPLVLSLVEFHLNDIVSTETGVRAFDAKFGSAAGTYFRIPHDLPSAAASSELLRLVNEDLKVIHGIVTATHRAIIAMRCGEVTEDRQNLFQPGDFVLHKQPGANKLKFHWYGPLEVIKQRRNNVEARHLATGAVDTYHVSRLKLFVGTAAQAREAAMRDQDQFTLECILTYQGNPLRRSETRYYVRFQDGDTAWLPYHRDLYETVQFADFISSRPELYILTLPTSAVSKFIGYVKSLPIPTLHLPDPTARRPTRAWMDPLLIGSTVYVDLRFWSDDGHNWYFELNLPHALTAIYVVPITYTAWGSQQRTVFFECPLFDYSDCFNAYQVFAYGSQSRFNSATMRLVDPALVVSFPAILPSEHRARLLRKFRAASTQSKSSGRQQSH